MYFGALGAALLLLASQVSAHLEKHGPHDRFWKHNKEERSLEVDGVNQFQNIETCIDEMMKEEDKIAMTTQTASQRNITNMYYDNYEEWNFMVTVENAITPSHVAAVRALGGCVRKFIPRAYEVRSMSIEFGYDHDVGLGGNCPTHLAPLVELFLPHVFHDMRRLLSLVYDAANWSDFLPKNDNYRPYYILPAPKDVGFRAAEHLTYDEFKEGLKDHMDGLDTKYTFNYAFSGPDEYGGGEFYIKHGRRREHKMHLKPKKYEAMVFLGGYYLHGVEPITSGKREMFSNELWTYPDAPYGSNLWSNTADRMEKYIAFCDRELEKGNTGPCKVDFGAIVGNGRYNAMTNGEKSDDDEEEEFDDEDDEDEFDEEEEMDGVPLRPAGAGYRKNLEEEKEDAQNGAATCSQSTVAS